MITLAIETSVKNGGCCVLSDGYVAAECCFSESRTASEWIVIAIQEMLADMRINYMDIDNIAVGTGPGSFTGLRVGMIAAKTLAFFLKKNLFLIPTLDALAFSLSHQVRPIVAILNAYRGEVYCASYESQPQFKRLCDYQVCDIREIWKPSEPFVVIGDAIEMYQDVLNDITSKSCEFAPQPLRSPNARNVGILANTGMLQPIQRTDIFSAVPHYIRKSEAEVKWEQKNLMSR